MPSRLFPFLFGSRREWAPGETDAIFLHGGGDFQICVVGVSRHLDEVREIVGGGLQPGQSRPYLARLIVRGIRSQVKDAVAIAIDERIVGYCPAYLATRYREWLNKWHLENAHVSCRAIISCTQSEESGERRYSVDLDLELPLKMTTLTGAAKEP